MLNVMLAKPRDRGGIFLLNPAIGSLTAPSGAMIRINNVVIPDGKRALLIAKRSSATPAGDLLTPGVVLPEDGVEYYTSLFSSGTSGEDSKINNSNTMALAYLTGNVSFVNNTGLTALTEYCYALLLVNEVPGNTSSIVYNRHIMIVGGGATSAMTNHRKFTTRR